MMISILLSLTVQPTLTHAFAKKRDFESPCAKIRVLRPGEIDLSETEKRLLCGDDDEEHRTGRAWKDIPVAQAKAHFRNFLQDRGFFFPEFRDIGSGVIEFDPGPRSFVKKISGSSIPPQVFLDKYRYVKGDPLTPKAVGTVKAWVKKRLQEEGFPCPELEANGDPSTGEILIKWLNVRPPATIAGIREDGSIGLANDVIRRYDAFKLGWPYSLVTTEITERRAMSSRVVLSDDLEPECLAQVSPPMIDRVAVKETLHAGPPRLISFGVGANTESLILAKAAWSHTRLGRVGSNFEVLVRGSLREQLALARGDWYYHDQNAMRQRISPFVQFSHENERRYELISARTQALWQFGGEVPFGSWTFGVGPGWQNIKQLDGLGPRETQYMTVKNELSFTSHNFEYYSSSPRNGARAALSTTYVPFKLENVGYPISLKLSATALTAPGHFDPPWIVLGARGRVSVTLLDEETRIGNVPIEFRDWTGGGQTVRGFGRYELPDNDAGARVILSYGTEARVPHLLPFNLQPFVFIDGAWLRTGEIVNGERTQGFWSPGIGLRWESPIGALRANLAHGYEIGNPSSNLSHLQFYLSLGEEF